MRVWTARGLIAQGHRDQEAEIVRTGVELLEEAAKMGNSTARRRLAQVYLAGVFGVEVDKEKGIALLREAVADGDGDAEMALAQAIYWKTPPTDAEVLWDAATTLWRDRNDYVVAHRLMGRAARLSFVPAMRDYAQMLREGIGCDKDPRLAADIEWQADELSKGKEDNMK